MQKVDFYSHKNKILLVKENKDYFINITFPEGNVGGFVNQIISPSSADQKIPD